MKSPPPTLSWALAIFIILTVLYSLTYSGLFSTDDEHILAAQALSFAFDDAPGFSRVFGNGRVFSYSRLNDPYSDQALNIEPAQAVLGSLLVKSAAALDLGRVQALFLLNIWVTAFTAVIVFLTAKKMGSSVRAALVTAAFFGLGTIAFPYSKTYFRDPLAMMFLACAWYFTCAIKMNLVALNVQRRNTLNWVGLAFSVILGVLSKNIVLLALPVILLDIVLAARKTHTATAGNVRTHARRWRWIFSAVVILAVVLIWLLIVPGVSILARFTPHYYALLVNFFTSAQRPNFLEAVSGPFISPGKSIFIFSPVLILSLWSLVFKFRSSWAGWSCLILMVVAQALFYDFEWSGHINWGLRYLLPALPPLLLTIVPIVEKMLKTWTGKLILVLMGLLSLIIQLLGALVPVGTYYREMYALAEPVSECSTIWQARYSIVLWNARWLLSGQPLDIALARIPEAAVPVILFEAVIVVCVLLFSRVKCIRRFLWIMVAICLALNWIMLVAFKHEPAYAVSRSDFTDSQQYLFEWEQSDDEVFIRSYGTPIWYYWMNWASPQTGWTSLPYYFPMPSLIEKYKESGNPEDALNASTLAILEGTLEPGGKLWLLTPSDAPGADLEMEKNWLTNHSSSRSCVTFKGEAESTEVCRFTIPPT